MKEEIDFNVNQNVKVKITPYGKECLRRNYDRKMSCYAELVYPFELPKEDEDGYTTFQLWDLMREFGEYMFMGNKNPFAMNIKLIKE